MDLNNLCRTCLRIPKSPRNLFTSQNDLVKKIETISSVVIEQNMELPQQICEECYENINACYSFRKVILNTDYDLKARLDTLKMTNYTYKPRRKMKTRPESPLLNIKTECDTELIVADANSNLSEEDFSILKALAMRKIYKCGKCKQVFPSKCSANRHKRNAHPVLAVCNICGLMLRADNLPKHIKLHSEGPVDCEKCGKTFKNSESLRTHKLIHSEMQFTCEMCGRSFKLKSEHTRHMKLHNDPDFRKSSCKLCGKKVADPRKHMLTHTGERPHICDYCNKGFTSRYALKVHRRQHTNEKPYMCHLCGIGFPQRVSLKTHSKSKHGLILDMSNQS